MNTEAPGHPIKAMPTPQKGDQEAIVKPNSEVILFPVFRWNWEVIQNTKF